MGSFDAVQNLFNGTEIEIHGDLVVKLVGVVTVTVVTENHFTVNLRGVISVGDLDFAEGDGTDSESLIRIEIEVPNRPADFNPVQLHHTVFVTFHCGTSIDQF